MDPATPSPTPAEIVPHVAFPVALTPLPLPWVAVLLSGFLSVISLCCSGPVGHSGSLLPPSVKGT